MGGELRRCKFCGALVTDSSAERCPQCHNPLGLKEPSVTESRDWAAIDDAWGDLSSEPPSAPGGARTLVGMGVADIEVALSQYDDIAVPGSPRPPEPASVGDALRRQPSVEAAVEPVMMAAVSSEAPEVLGPGEVLLAEEVDPQGLATIPLEGLPAAARSPLVPVATGPVEPASSLDSVGGRRRGDGGGLQTLPPEGMPDFSRGLATLDMAPSPELARSIEAEASRPAPGGEVERSDRDQVAPSDDQAPGRRDVRDFGGGPERQGLSSDGSFADHSANVPRAMVSKPEGISYRLMVLWLVALASVVAAVLVLVLT